MVVLKVCLQERSKKAHPMQRNNVYFKNSSLNTGVPLIAEKECMLYNLGEL